MLSDLTNNAAFVINGLHGIFKNVDHRLFQTSRVGKNLEMFENAMKMMPPFNMGYMNSKPDGKNKEDKA